jgi:hypothetical protein
MKLGYRVEDHQQKVFIEKNSDQKNFSKKIVEKLLSPWVILFSSTIEKQ